MDEHARQQAFVTALVTERFVQGNARAATINEANGRAAIYLSTVSSGLAVQDPVPAVPNQILTEMDGFTGTENVIVLAATNRPETLDRRCSARAASTAGSPSVRPTGRLTLSYTCSRLRQPGRLVPLAACNHAAACPKERRMVVPADQPRRVRHYQAALVRDQDGVTARCLELGWLCAHGRDADEALARLRDLVAMELSHRADHPWPLYAVVVPLDVPTPARRR